VFDATDQYLRGVVRSTVVARHARDGEVTGLGATPGEDDAAGLRPTKAATSSRASSTARRASRAARWLPEGLPTRRVATAPWRPRPRRDAARKPRDRSSTGSRHVEGLDVRELTHAKLTSSRPKPDSFVPPKATRAWRRRRSSRRPYRRQARDGGVDLLLVRRVDCAAEAPRRRVGEGDGGVESSTNFDDSNRPKSSSLPARESTGTSVNTVAGK